MSTSPHAWKASGYCIEKPDLTKSKQGKNSQDDAQNPDGNESGKGSLGSDNAVVLEGLLQIDESIHCHERQVMQ